MLEGYICPDGNKVSVKGCLSKCRMGERCLTLPTLSLISREREWTGHTSTTQLLQGTMEAFLKLTQPYYIDPQSRAWSLSGTKFHANLEEEAKRLGLPAEIAMSMDRDVIDYVEVDEMGIAITDRKLWGSFHIVKILGIVEAGKKPDSSGAVYARSGKWGQAGSPKMITVWKEDKSQADTFETDMQLNHYRVLLGKYGIKATCLQIEAVVRDGGLAVATSRGVVKNIYKIPISILPDDEVIAYFTAKDHDLQQALEQGHWDVVCSVKESWDGRKCESYCDVWFACKKGILVRKIGEKDE